MSYILMAIPFFFLLIAVEYVLSLIQRRQLYRLNDSVNDLSMGIIDRVGGAFFESLVFAAYLYIWNNWRLLDMGATSIWDAKLPLWTWIACFIAKDLAYYWAHRMSHEMNIGWATHIAHHQSEEYNLSVALRQGVFQSFFFTFFYWPLALIGFPPALYVVCSQLNTIYQFWIHTRTVGKLGPLEWFMNTPSHHRVHHGRDPKYIDKNHGGTFIVWDRLFGTFKEEEEEPHYGLVTPLKSWNPIWAQIHYFVRLLHLTWNAPRLGDKLRLWYKRPAWVPGGLESEGPTSQDRWTEGEFKKYDTRISRGMSVYVLLHFAAVAALTLGFLNLQGEMTWPFRAAAAGFILWTLVCLGGIFEHRSWVQLAEPARLVGLLLAIRYWGEDLFGYRILAESWLHALVLCATLGFLLWLLLYRRELAAKAVAPSGGNPPIPAASV